MSKRSPTPTPTEIASSAVVAKAAKSSGTRLSRADWVVAEEMYRQGSTQQEIADKFRIRVETVSRHMTKREIEGGSAVNIVRKEIELAVARKKREFAEKVADRKIKAKDQSYMMTQGLLSLFAKEMQGVKERNEPLGVLVPAARALKDSIAGVTAAWDQFVKVLDIKPGEDSVEQLPELVVRGMTPEEEKALRDRKIQDDAMEEAVVEEGIDSLAHESDPAELETTGEETT